MGTPWLTAPCPAGVAHAHSKGPVPDAKTRKGDRTSLVYEDKQGRDGDKGKEARRASEGVTRRARMQSCSSREATHSPQSVLGRTPRVRGVMIVNGEERPQPGPLLWAVKQRGIRMEMPRKRVPVYPFPPRPASRAWPKRQFRRKEENDLSAAREAAIPARGAIHRGEVHRPLAYRHPTRSRTELPHARSFPLDTISGSIVECRVRRSVDGTHAVVGADGVLRGQRRLDRKPKGKRSRQMRHWLRTPWCGRRALRNQDGGGGRREVDARALAGWHGEAQGAGNGSRENVTKVEDESDAYGGIFVASQARKIGRPSTSFPAATKARGQQQPALLGRERQVDIGLPGYGRCQGTDGSRYTPHWEGSVPQRGGGLVRPPSHGGQFTRVMTVAPQTTRPTHRGEDGPTRQYECGSTLQSTCMALRMICRGATLEPPQYRRILALATSLDGARRWIPVYHGQGLLGVSPFSEQAGGDVECRRESLSPWPSTDTQLRELPVQIIAGNARSDLPDTCHRRPWRKFSAPSLGHPAPFYATVTCFYSPYLPVLLQQFFDEVTHSSLAGSHTIFSTGLTQEGTGRANIFLRGTPPPRMLATPPYPGRVMMLHYSSPDPPLFISQA
ncbi:hypothetical protein DFH06DRAFT_1145837 [Mycena polygramma]|nr:hypothetical protein DFH06DRAFT_1145837 [Mycena polygramma]